MGICIILLSTVFIKKDFFLSSLLCLRLRRNASVRLVATLCHVAFVFYTEFSLALEKYVFFFVSRVKREY